MNHPFLRTFMQTAAAAALAFTLTAQALAFTLTAQALADNLK